MSLFEGLLFLLSLYTTYLQNVNRCYQRKKNQTVRGACVTGLGNRNKIFMASSLLRYREPGLVGLVLQKVSSGLVGRSRDEHQGGTVNTKEGELLSGGNKIMLTDVELKLP